jgi:hypothetical protein
LGVDTEQRRRYLIAPAAGGVSIDGVNNMGGPRCTWTAEQGASLIRVRQ